MPRNRSLGLDILKGILALLVIMGHVFQIRIAAGDGTSLMCDTKYFIYSFHMPLFIALTGYFREGKNISYGPFVKKSTIQLLVPFIVWGTLIAFYDYYILNISGNQVVHDFITTDLWYLKSLFIILLLSLPFIARKKTIWAVPVVIIGLIAGNLFLLALQIPSFFLGYYIHKYKHNFKNSYIRYTILALSLILFCVELFVIIPNIETSGKLSLQTLPEISNYLNRLVLSSSAVIFLLCLFGKQTSSKNGGGKFLLIRENIHLGYMLYRVC